MQKAKNIDNYCLEVYCDSYVQYSMQSQACLAFLPLSIKTKKFSVNITVCEFTTSNFDQNCQAILIIIIYCH